MRFRRELAALDRELRGGRLWRAKYAQRTPLSKRQKFASTHRGSIIGRVARPIVFYPATLLDSSRLSSPSGGFSSQSWEIKRRFSIPRACPIALRYPVGTLASLENAIPRALPVAHRYPRAIVAFAPIFSHPPELMISGCYSTDAGDMEVRGKRDNPVPGLWRAIPRFSPTGRILQ